MLFAGLLLMPFGSADIFWIQAAAGLSATHLFRTVIVRLGWRERPVVQIWPWVGVGLLLTAALAQSMKMVGWSLLIELTGRSFFAGVLDYSLLIVPWTLIYFCYHHIRRSRQQCVRNKDLNQRVVSMQEEYERSGTDLGEMLVRLQRISGLIEADPDRSREEITEFSKLLRNGYMR